jgi:N-acetylneuraminic acid mutarotase
VAGGFTGTEYNNTLEVYDARSDAWLTLTDMPTARGFLAAASLGGKLYAIGGRNETGLLTATEAYDPSVRR